METENNDTEPTYGHNRTGRVLAGLVILGAGAVMLLHKLGYIFPSWLFSWPVLLILLGLFIGARHTFRGFGWLIPVVIGLAFLADDFYPHINFKPFIVPVLLILGGMFLIFTKGPRWGRHRRNRHMHVASGTQQTDWVEHWQKEQEKKSLSNDDVLDITAVFGGVKKTFISKDFKGGEVNCVIGGAELNLGQADIHGRVVLELNNVLGGTKLIVPSSWHIQSEIAAVLGGVEDNRHLQASGIDPNKILLLKGTCFMGGITIMSY